MKAGVVLLVGRPNVGKSTLLNAILGHKVSITSPKPQTTRFAVQAVFQNDQGQIIFVDTPGIYGKSHDSLAKTINRNAEDAMSAEVDCVLHIVDHARQRELEENKALGMVRKIAAPKILVINKVDVKRPTYIMQYKFMEDEFDTVMEISALKRSNINRLIDTIFDYLPEKEQLVDTTTMSQPGLNVDSKTFVSEIIREKAFLNLRKEVPYTITSVVDELTERSNGSLYIKGRILTNDDRYKGMIVGRNGAMIKEISMAVRKEIEVASGKKVFVELTVEVDPHWIEYL